MKYKFLVASVLMVSVVLLVPVATKAVDIQSQIQVLMQQIAALQAQLKELQSQQQGDSGQSWCYTFNKNLGIGASGSDFDALITVLDKESISEFTTSNRPSEYNEIIAGAASAFQQKYASEILVPNGLRNPTGYVGPSTRKKLNALYGCKSVEPLEPLPPKVTLTVNGITNYTTVVENTSIALSWSSSNTVSCSSSGGYSNWAQSIRPTNGSVELRDPIKVSTVFNITCVNSAGISTTNGVQVNVKELTAQPSITVTSPNGGEQLTTGQTYTIRWNSTNLLPTENVKIELALNHNDPTYVAGNRFEDWIIEKTPNTGSYSWTISEFYGLGLDASSFSVKISYGKNVVDYSNTNFTIKMGSSNPSLNITGPIAGETYKPGDRITFSWTPKDDLPYSLTLLKKSDASFVRWLTVYPINYPVEQSYYWDVISGIFGNDYYLRVETSKNANRANVGYSPIFTINPVVTQPSITISDPSGNQGVTVKVGDTFTISGAPKNIQGLQYYTGTGYPIAGYYSRAFFFDSIFNEDCSNNDASNSVWSMTCVARTTGVGNIYIEIYANNQVYKSNVVTVTVLTTTQPSITVASPNGGEAWKVGETRSITWTHSSCSSVNVYYTNYSGGTPISIATVPANQGIYAWTIPSTISVNSNIRVGVSCVGTSVSDLSDNYFTIVAPTTAQPSITVTSPNGGEVWAPGSTQTIKWTSSGLSGQARIRIYCSNCLESSGLTYDIEDISKGSFSRVIPPPLRASSAPSQYWVSVEDNSGNVTDSSDNFFTIAVVAGNQKPVISSVSGPTSIVMGQTGTWTVNATDPENDLLSYRVIWGDSAVDLKYYSTNTFTHSFTMGPSYQNPTQYQNVFYVKDSAGNETRQDVYVSVSRAVGTLDDMAKQLASISDAIANLIKSMRR